MMLDGFLKTIIKALLPILWDIITNWANNGDIGVAGLATAAKKYRSAAKLNGVETHDHKA